MSSRAISESETNDSSATHPQWHVDVRGCDLARFDFAKSVLAHLDLGQWRRNTLTEMKSVDLSRIVGTHHSDYALYSWGELKPGENRNYDRLKRAHRALVELAMTPEYYLTANEKSGWSFYEDPLGNIYIAEGNHRSILARYFLALNNLPQVVHGVFVTKIFPVEVRPPAEEIRCLKASGGFKVEKLGKVLTARRNK
jgi:hypothetical protein